MTAWDIWAEGFASNGGLESATRLTKTPVEADTFDEAVVKHVESASDSHLFHKKDSGWTYWGCRLFDNETDARASFG